MITHNDFEEFLRLLNATGAKYVIIGGYAVAFHGHIRSTGDLDIFFGRSAENITAVMRALRQFGFSESVVDRELFEAEDNIIRIGVPPIRIELMSNISGVSFSDVWESRVEGRYGDVETAFISLSDLITNKRASARPKDMLDADQLESDEN